LVNYLQIAKDKKFKNSFPFSLHFWN